MMYTAQTQLRVVKIAQDTWMIAMEWKEQTMTRFHMKITENYIYDKCLMNKNTCR